MKKLVYFICIMFVFTANAKVGIIVNKDMYPFIRANVQRYVTDLINTSETVWIDTSTFGEPDTSLGRAQLQELRDSLRYHYISDNLTGAVLIGNLPYAMYEIGHANLETVHIRNYSYESYPVDYYFMDLDKTYDNDWLDDSTETTRPGVPGDTTYPYKSGVFDGYTGDKFCEIWVSRVIGHNLYHNTTPATHIPEDSVLNAYLDRMHVRMTQPATVARRAIQVGDFKNWFDTSWAHIENLNIPFSNLKFPNDRAPRYVAELRKGYEWVTILEHSGPDAHVMGMDQGPIETGGHDTRFHAFNNPSFAEERSLLQMMDVDHLPPNALFFQDLGCSNVDFNFDSDQGEMYAMLGSGLICMGSSKEYHPTTHNTYTSNLGTGECFGESFRRFVNDPYFEGGNWNHLVNPGDACLVLMGAGTLKEAPYVIPSQANLNIDSMVVTAGPEVGQYLLHDDVLKLHAKISASNGSALNPSLLKLTWYGCNDSAVGNDVNFALDGHDAPRYQNGRNQGTYTIMLHAEYPGYYSASKKVELDGWSFSKIDTTAGLDTSDAIPNLNHHRKTATGYDLFVRGASGDINGNADDFVYYYRNVNMPKFYISAQVKSMTTTSVPSAKAGVMLRTGLNTLPDAHGCKRFSGTDQQVFIGLTYSGSVVFQYRTVTGGATTTRSYSGYTVGNTWVKLVKTPTVVYGMVSTNGTAFRKIDSLTTTLFSSPIAGFAYAANDTSLWGTGERSVVFSKMEVKEYKAINTPSFFAGDSIVAGSRVRFESSAIGAKNYLKFLQDDTIIGNVFVSGNARLEDRTKVNGDMTLSGRLTSVNGGTCLGTLTENADVQFEPLTEKSFSVGTANISVGRNVTTTLNGGSYKTVYVESNGTLILNAGTYYFDSLSINCDAKLTMNGHVEINVQKGILINDRAVVSGLPASDKIFYSNGALVSIGQCTVSGYFNVPKGKVKLINRAIVKGKIAAKTITLDNDTKVYAQ